ncbi:MAG TPA: hypothetical protein VIR82_05465 [Bradyrhizobium sp.]
MCSVLVSARWLLRASIPLALSPFTIKALSELKVDPPEPTSCENIPPFGASGLT